MSWPPPSTLWSRTCLPTPPKAQGFVSNSDQHPAEAIRTRGRSWSRTKESDQPTWTRLPVRAQRRSVAPGSVSTLCAAPPSKRAAPQLSDATHTAGTESSCYSPNTRCPPAAARQPLQTPPAPTIAPNESGPKIHFLPDTLRTFAGIVNVTGRGGVSLIESPS
jgi:hypothetical protein